VEGVGGTKDPVLAKIKELKPDRILVNTEENRPEDIRSLKAIAPVLETFPTSPWDVPEMFRVTGEFFGTSALSEKMSGDLQLALETLKETVRNHRQGFFRRFVYLIWTRPWMAVGEDTYISRLLNLAGWQNALTGGDRYPVVSLEELKKVNPDVCFFSSEPWPFRTRDLEAFCKEWGRDDRPEFLKIDGRLMSWYGPATHVCVSQWLKWIKGEPDSLIKKFPI